MWLYNIAITLYEWLVCIVACWNKKARLWVDGRKNLFERMAQAIGEGERIVWVHVASLGEFEQGRPIIEKIRAERPEYKILVTFYSPSGYEIRKNYEGADYIFYLPTDTPSNVRRFLDIAHPEVAIFVKYEFWLNMLAELQRRKVRTYIISSIFRRGSIFFRSYGDMWRNALNAFDLIFVQDEASKELLSEIGYDNVVVAGDTRFDRVAQIAAAAKRVDVVEQFRGESRLFVAGSTWGPDEDILLPLINANPDIKFVVAPHEMDEGRINKIIGSTICGAVRYTQLDSATLDKAQVLILDTVGLLSSVYGYATWSYIGGGFGVGIHNTLEAATFGLPIAFGPNYSKFKEARDMVSLGAACSVTSAEELSAWFEPLRDNADHLAETSHISKEYTSKNQGATQIIFKSLF
ncbi:MAG: 3-deoxy-D-manno-octulosonic acid transferase [Alistipes sp.]|nr:3-deoxy-D-manno-octulosonic acid transferase [Alistipes sp.]